MRKFPHLFNISLTKNKTHCSLLLTAIVYTCFIWPGTLYGQSIECSYAANIPSAQDEQGHYYTNDPSIDIHFYYLELRPEWNERELHGQVHYMMSLTRDSIRQIRLDLAPEMQVTAFTAPVVDQMHSDRVLHLFFDTYYHKGDTIRFTLSFSGRPALLNDIKGLHFRNHSNSDPLIVSLSTPYLAHQWWPCKDGPEDKADSVYIDLYVPNAAYGGIPLSGVSNGLLEAVRDTPGGKCYQWRHRYPIVPYYIMIAVAPFVRLEQTFRSENENAILLEYFVFRDHVQAANQGLAQMPELMQYFENLFGPYPFRLEKYGMTQLGFYGGIENQTNTIINRMSSDYFLVIAHELAHMWFGDMLTCSTWREAWLNEGFASYAECLWTEFRFGEEAYHQCMAGKRYLGPERLYQEDDGDPFDIFRTVIYHKGAWFLHMLRGILGDTAFFDALHAYATNPSLSYGHVNAEHLKEIFEEFSPIELDPFFDQWICGNYFPVFRYSFRQHADGNTEFLLVQDQLVLPGAETLFDIPVSLSVRFADGTDTLVQIIHSGPLQSYSWHFSKSVTDVIPDPEDYILCQKSMDVLLNTAQPQEAGFSLYPNPALRGEPVWLKNNGASIRTLIINDQTGHFRVEIPVTPGSNEQEIPTTNIGFPGLYFIEIQTYAPPIRQFVPLLLFDER